LLYKQEITFTDFSEFKEKIDIFSDRNRANEKKQLFLNGITYSGQNVIANENGRILYEFSHENNTHPVVVYVSYQKIKGERVRRSEINPEYLNRYHFYNCEHIENILRNGYDLTISGNTDYGFPYQILNQYGEIIHYKKDMELYPCERCLDIFNHQNKTLIRKEEFQKSYLFSEK
jgi:hypothetical protein